MNPGLHDALQAMGPQAAQVVDLWRVFLSLCTAVFVVVLLVLLWALVRSPRSDADTPADLSSVNRPEPGPRRNVTAAVSISAVLLMGLVGASVATDRTLARMSLVDAVNIEVTANQWWWSARYVNGPPSDVFETANEIHIPVGKPVVMTLRAGDVIHSFWVPSLTGKKDLVPGRTATLRLRADQPGLYRGQCAEFCGFQHALMGLQLIAEPPAQFEAWQVAQRAPAAESSDARAQRGKALFQSVSCAMCHTVQGTLAQGKHAPDLTHLASRQTLAAGTLRNTPQKLTEWIADPQKHKPGVQMPATPLSREDLASLVAYLETLK